MSEIPVPVDPTEVVEADRKYPVKAIIAAVAAAGTAVLTEYADQLPLWAVILLGALVAGLGTFSVANPLTLKKDTGWKRGEAGEAYLGLIIGVLLILILVVVLLRVL